MHSLVLISSRADDKIFVESIANALGLETFVYNDVGAWRKVQIKDDIVFVDINDEISWSAFEEAAANHEANRIHLFFDSTPQLCASPAHFDSKVVGNWIRRPGDAAEVAALHYGRVLRSLSDSAPRLSELVSLGTSIQKLEVQNSIQKEFVTESVRGYLVEAGCIERSANVIANSLDELIMNAIYNAPVDANGKRIYNEPPISQALDLEGRNRVEIEVATEGSFALISVTDFYGSLSRDTIVKHVARSYNGYQNNSIQSEGSRAGLGLALIFRSGGSYHFSIDPGIRTTVSIIFDITGRFRETRDRFQFLSTFVSQ